MGREFRLYGIFGFPLGHTLSPAMQEAAFRAIGLKAFYLPFEVGARGFRRLMRGRRRLLLDGFNVTVPYKQEVVRYLDRVDPTARTIGAVNTVVRKGNRWIGFNTDVVGFIRSLEKDARYRIHGKEILILGAGGSARAVAYALAKRGAKEITLANRTVSRAKRIVADYQRRFPGTRLNAVIASPATLVAGRSNLRARRLRSLSRGRRLLRSLRGLAMTAEGSGTSIDLVVNATSVGLGPKDRSLVSPKDFPKKTLFVDLIYNPAETRFLRLARQSGHRTLNGIGMLVYQGAEAFRLWTGRKPPMTVMRETVKSALREAQ